MGYQPDNPMKYVMSAAALAVSLPLAGGAVAQSGNEAGDPREWEDWRSMQEEVISADRLLTADVSNGFNPVGSVRSLVLNEEGTAVQYILYEAPYPYSFYGAEDGFTTFDGVDFRQTDPLEPTVTFDPEVQPQAPEEIALTEEEAEHRLVSNIIDGQVYFSDDEARSVSDILIDRETGELAFFVVDMEDESLFDLDTRAIPADMVSIEDEGRITASVDTNGVEDITQEYEQEFL